MDTIQEINKEYFRTDLPQLEVGDKVEIITKNFKKSEKDKYRLTHFKGTVIAQKNKQRISYNFSVLKESKGKLKKPLNKELEALLANFKQSDAELSCFWLEFPLAALDSKGEPVLSAGFINIDGKEELEWYTSEHLFQALKFTGTNKDIDLVRQILNQTDTMQALKLGQSKLARTMKYAVRQKFSQNETLKDKLLATGNKTIIENTKSNGPDERGANHLGEILMEVRDELAAQNQPLNPVNPQPVSPPTPNQPTPGENNNPPPNSPSPNSNGPSNNEPTDNSNNNPDSTRPNDKQENNDNSNNPNIELPALDTGKITNAENIETAQLNAKQQIQELFNKRLTTSQAIVEFSQLLEQKIKEKQQSLKNKNNINSPAKPNSANKVLIFSLGGEGSIAHFGRASVLHTEGVSLLVGGAFVIGKNTKSSPPDKPVKEEKDNRKPNQPHNPSDNDNPPELPDNPPLPPTPNDNETNFSVLAPTKNELEYKTNPPLPISSVGTDYSQLGETNKNSLLPGSALLTDTLDGSGGADRYKFEKLAIPLVGGGIYLGSCDPQKLAEGIMIGKMSKLMTHYFHIHEAHVIVNAANTQAKFGGGLSGKIAEEVGDKTKIEQKAEE
ncbi:15094_t:CDS:10 [Entrophospora sp. SA101]|nr:15094_t:CDS:10 [Entrophospora sp. SA101]